MTADQTFDLRRQDQLNAAMDALAAQCRHVRDCLQDIGYPVPRVRDQGFHTLLRILLGQKISVTSADAVWVKTEAALGQLSPVTVLQAVLTDHGWSRTKAGYAQDLARHLQDGNLDFSALPGLPDEEAKARLTAVRGIGPWTADVYLLFAEGRQNVFAEGDLALRKAAGWLFECENEPDQPATLRLIDHWHPFRGAGAMLLWHLYAQRQARKAVPV